MTRTLYVSPQGCDSWHGHLAEPAANGMDGPLATLSEAVKRVRHLREQRHSAGQVVVRVAAGRYPTKRPIEIRPEDSGIRFVAEGEAVIDGSIGITGWSVEQVNGRPCWVTDVGALLTAVPQPRSLFANGERRPRSRYPKQDWLTIRDAPDVPETFDLFDGASRFIAAQGDFDEAWRNPTNIEAVINHLWIEERMPVSHYDAAQRMVTSTHRSIFTLRNHEWMGSTPCAKYFWENVFEAMSEPGEWYLDRDAERLYYLPKEGETPENTDVRLAVATQVIRLHGDWETGKTVRGVRFEGFTFAHTDWFPSEGWGRWWDPQTPEHTWPTKDSFRHFNTNNLEKRSMNTGTRFAAMPQAAHDLPGAVSLEAAEDCAFVGCTFRGLGFYAIDVRGACRGVRVERCRIDDIGGGGVKIDGADLHGDPRLRTGHAYVGDCTITRCGRVYPSAIGVAILHAANNTVEHNEIADQFYSAISVGWTWGFEQALCQQNLIQYNHLHHIGHGRLSDMGGIYTLGCQPGTILRGNHIHHIESGHYGGWGIYLDEGSAFMRVEGNLVHHTGSQAFNEHWGRQNIITDNVFALAGSELVQLCREEHGGQYHYPPQRCTFLRNVLLTDGGAVFKDAMTYFEAGVLVSDLNLYWDLSAQAEPTLWNYEPWDMLGKDARTIGLSEAREQGMDRHSMVADPGFASPESGDFTAADISAVDALGVALPDATKAGPRPEAPEWSPVLEAYRPMGPSVFTD
ncbi:MAG: right-handed parallel beta-helix repeat-containing protein [Planctomycetota bacterium]